MLVTNENADWEKSVEVILNAKTSKISACNALDKILTNTNLTDYDNKMIELKSILNNSGVSILVDSDVKKILKEEELIADETIWEKEFLSMKCCMGSVDSTKDAIQKKINIQEDAHPPK